MALVIIGYPRSIACSSEESSVERTVIRVGIQIMQHATYPQIREAWKAVDASAAETMFNWDHFFSFSGDPDGMYIDNRTAPGAVAEVTQQVQIRCLVSAIGYRNPNLFADMDHTLDHLSSGRAILWTGSGWNRRDHE